LGGRYFCEKACKMDCQVVSVILLEGSSPVLEEFLLPAVEDRRLGSFSSKCRLRMATFSSGAYCFRCFFMRSLLYFSGRTPSPFPTEPEQDHIQKDKKPLNESI